MRMLRGKTASWDQVVASALWDDSFLASQSAPMPSYSVGDALTDKTGYTDGSGSTNGIRVADIGGTRACVVSNAVEEDRTVSLDTVFPDNRRLSVTVAQLSSTGDSGQNSFYLHSDPENFPNYIRYRLRSDGSVFGDIQTPGGGLELFTEIASPGSFTVGDTISAEFNGTQSILRINGTIQHTHNMIGTPPDIGKPALRLVSNTGQTSLAISNITVEAV